MAEQWGISRKTGVCLAPAVLFAVACCGMHRRHCSALFVAAKDSSAAHRVCPRRKSLFRNMKRTASIRLKPVCASKSGRNVPVSNCKKLGWKLAFLFLIFGAGKTLFGQLVKADNAVLRLGETALAADSPETERHSSGWSQQKGPMAGFAVHETSTHLRATFCNTLLACLCVYQTKM